MDILNRKNKGLSTIITTLIIVTASVVLGTAVILFASGIFESSVEEEAITVTSTNLWGNTSTNSQLGFIVKNSGSTELAIATVKVRGIESPFTAWYTFDTADNTSITSQTVLSYQGGASPDLTNITMAGSFFNFTLSTGPLGIKPGETFVVYVLAPGSVDSTDAGSSATVIISALQATQVIRITISTP